MQQNKKNPTLTLCHDHDITLEQINAVSEYKSHLELDDATRGMLQERREDIVNFVNEQKLPAYGFNRGFGHNVDLAVEDEMTGVLQENLILSHCVGAGDAAPVEIIRMTMLLRAKSLIKGHSGVRPELVQHILDMLNHDIIPVVPQLGSVGASGDLAPLSHIALGMLGKGRVWYQEQEMNAAKALQHAGLQPLRLQMKEGLALNNGVQYMTAIGLYCCNKMQMYLKTAAIQSAMTAQVMLAPETPFCADLHQLRPHPGSVKVAEWIYNLMRNSPLREAHRDYRIDGEIQDPYNIRCAAQILGSCAELIDESERSLLLEANSVTDNPLLLKADKEYGWCQNSPWYGKAVDIVSGGHFHGMPVAVRVYNLFQAMGMMASLLNRRCARYVDANSNKGLGRDLKWPELSDAEKAVSSGMMMLEYTSAALANSIWGDCMPNHLFNISTNTGQEDHVSMGTDVAVRLLKSLPKLAQLLAIELAFINQAAAIRKFLPQIPSQVQPTKDIAERLQQMQTEIKNMDNPFEIEIQVREFYHLKPEKRQLNPVCENILAQVSSIFPVVKQDRPLADDLQKLTKYIDSGDMLSQCQENQ